MQCFSSHVNGPTAHRGGKQLTLTTCFNPACKCSPVSSIPPLHVPQPHPIVRVTTFFLLFFTSRNFLSVPPRFHFSIFLLFDLNIPCLSCHSLSTYSYSSLTTTPTPIAYTTHFFHLQHPLLLSSTPTLTTSHSTLHHLLFRRLLFG